MNIEDIKTNHDRMLYTVQELKKRKDKRKLLNRIKENDINDLIIGSILKKRYKR